MFITPPDTWHLVGLLGTVTPVNVRCPPVPNTSIALALPWFCAVQLTHSTPVASRVMLAPAMMVLNTGLVSFVHLDICRGADGDRGVPNLPDSDAWAQSVSTNPVPATHVNAVVSAAGALEGPKAAKQTTAMPIVTRFIASLLALSAGADLDETRSG